MCSDNDFLKREYKINLKIDVIQFVIIIELEEYYTNRAISLCLFGSLQQKKTFPRRQISGYWVFMFGIHFFYY